MLKLEIFDPPMCCSTGICGSSVDPTLVTFASDLEWLKKQGVNVVRHGLSFEPAEFVKNEEVKNILNSEGNSSLPMMVIDGKVVSKGHYVSREKLAYLCNIEFNAEDAPPVHREENCCCGEDCDCSTSHKSSNDSIVEKCDCTNAAAEDNCICGAECECHKSGISDGLKKLIFIIVILLMLGIIAAKYWGKAGAATAGNSQIYYESINSLKQISLTEDVAIIYIPVSGGDEITATALKSMNSAKKVLESKNINTALFMLKSKSTEYYQVSSKTKLPAVMTVVKGKGMDIVSEPITKTRLLQSYITAFRGGCSANCPCHKK